METKVHIFEKAGLGKAPFWVEDFDQAGTDSGRQGTTCDFCGTYITNIFFIKSSDDKKFVVGSTCVEKTDDQGLIKVVKTKLNQLRRERNEEKTRSAERQYYLDHKDEIEAAHEKERIEEEEYQIYRKAEFDRVISLLKDTPHPNRFFASKGKTMKDYADFCFGGDVEKEGDTNLHGQTIYRHHKTALIVADNGGKIYFADFLQSKQTKGVR